MRAVTFTMTKGRKVNGLIWTWQPEDGWMEVMEEPSGVRRRVLFKDIKEGVVFADRHREEHGVKDLLKDAKEDGWLD